MAATTPIIPSVISTSASVNAFDDFKMQVCVLIKKDLISFLNKMHLFVKMLSSGFLYFELPPPPSVRFSHTKCFHRFTPFVLIMYLLYHLARCLQIRLFLLSFISFAFKKKSFEVL